jgi:hypothetical protein
MPKADVAQADLDERPDTQQQGSIPMKVNDLVRPQNGTPSEAEIRYLARRWYRLLDEHAQSPRCCPC